MLSTALAHESTNSSTGTGKFNNIKQGARFARTHKGDFTNNFLCYFNTVHQTFPMMTFIFSLSPIHNIESKYLIFLFPICCIPMFKLYLLDCCDLFSIFPKYMCKIFLGLYTKLHLQGVIDIAPIFCSKLTRARDFNNFDTPTLHCVTFTS